LSPASNVTFIHLDNGLKEIAKEDEPTLLVFPDATSLASDNDFYRIFNNALIQCHDLKDRFTIIDTYRDAEYDGEDPIASLRSGISFDKNHLKYGAVYFPFLETTLEYSYDESKIDVVISSGAITLSSTAPTSITFKLDTLKTTNKALYTKIKVKLARLSVKLPPSSAMVGIYARVDSYRGIWKAPANVSLNYVLKPTVKITNEYQNGLSIDPVAGKSINAIRHFTGKGTLVWDSRTLAGNDNEWKYIPVRRLFIMVEESIQKATSQFVFEPNHANTWIRIKAMIEDFLIKLWRNGAIAGTKPEHAFFVMVGLGQTMSSLDILEGRMIIQIGLAPIRPAEFIICQISQKMHIA
jgi:phage tail sheath protein FI